MSFKVVFVVFRARLNSWLSHEAPGPRKVDGESARLRTMRKMNQAVTAHRVTSTALARRSCMSYRHVQPEGVHMSTNAKQSTSKAPSNQPRRAPTHSGSQQSDEPVKQAPQEAQSNRERSLPPQA